MPIAFVLISAEMGSESEVLKELKKIDAVKEAHEIYGTYDIIAKVEADTLGKLKEAVNWQMRRLKKIRSTWTMIAIEETI